MKIKIVGSEEMLKNSLGYGYPANSIIKAGAIFKVMIHETSHFGIEWYLIDIGVNLNEVYCSDTAVAAGNITRHYHSPLLEKDYRDGNYVWIKSEFCELYEEAYFNSNKHAKFLLEQQE